MVTMVAGRRAKGKREKIKDKSKKIKDKSLPCTKFAFRTI